MNFYIGNKIYESDITAGELFEALQQNPKRRISLNMRTPQIKDNIMELNAEELVNSIR